MRKERGAYEVRVPLKESIDPNDTYISDIFKGVACELEAYVFTGSIVNWIAVGDSFENILKRYLCMMPQLVPDAASTDTIAAVELVEEFSANVVAASLKYDGKDLVVEGVVTAVDYDWEGKPYVALGSGDWVEINTVSCMVSNVSGVAAISVGDKIEVQGTFSEWDGLDVVLKPCSI